MCWHLEVLEHFRLLLHEDLLLLLLEHLARAAVALVNLFSETVREVVFRHGERTGRAMMAQRAAVPMHPTQILIVIFLLLVLVVLVVLNNRVISLLLKLPG